jgi:hypothetical protein
LQHAFDQKNCHYLKDIISGRTGGFNGQTVVPVSWVG